MRIASSTVLATLVAVAVLLGAPAMGTAPGAAYAQTGPTAAADSTATERVEQAFRSGSAEDLLEGAPDRLDVIIFGKGASYSRAQAALVLTDFFRRHPPARVAFEQEVLAEDRRSMIGTYWVENGESEPVAVFVRLWAREADWQLRSIRIERSENRR